MQGLRILLLLLLGMSSSASAMFFNGHQLRDALDQVEANTSFANRTLTMGYVMGVYDVVEPGRLCSEQEISARDATAVVHRWLRAHPEALNQRASVLVAAALSEHYPCKR